VICPTQANILYDRYGNMIFSDFDYDYHIDVFNMFRSHCDSITILDDKHSGGYEHKIIHFNGMTYQPNKVVCQMFILDNGYLVIAPRTYIMILNQTLQVIDTISFLQGIRSAFPLGNDILILATDEISIWKLGHNCVMREPATFQLALPIDFDLYITLDSKYISLFDKSKLEPISQIEHPFANIKKVLPIHNGNCVMFYDGELPYTVILS
jgi:hypothetical protein